MTGKQAGKPLSFKACTMTKSTDKNQAEPSKIRRLRAAGIRTSFGRYTSLAGNRLSQLKIGSTTQTRYLMVTKLALAQANQK
ncbi:DUF4102 domain-containing protein [Serratia sp. 3ACOL1]|nr:DUF4102 domain-containing protein [Serratia sp. 3ACOL1]